MRVKCLECEALARIIYLCAAHSPHIVDAELFRLGLHSEPAELRALLQSKIDAATGQGYGALLLAYGLCGQAAARDDPRRRHRGLPAPDCHRA